LLNVAILTQEATFYRRVNSRKPFWLLVAHAVSALTRVAFQAVLRRDRLCEIRVTCNWVPRARNCYSCFFISSTWTHCVCCNVEIKSLQSL